MTITVKFRDGTVKRFEDRGRPGGSYSNSIATPPGFVIITDCYGSQTIYPSDLVSSVETEGRRSW